MATATVEQQGIHELNAAQQVSIALIDTSLNPRQHFDGEKIAALAATLKTSGMIQAIVVRRHPDDEDRYQLVAGGRRLKAAEAAGWDEIPARICDGLSDAEALEIALVENFQREDLSPIEEAQAFQTFCKPAAAGGLGYTQQRLADRLGCSQPHIANRLRLLHLPDKWQQKIITGEIPHSLARHLLPVAKHKPILAEIEKALKAETHNDEPVTEESFQEIVEMAIREHSGPVDHHEYVSGVGHVELMSREKLTDDEREQLGIIEVNSYGEKELRATNTHLWETMIKAKREELLAKAKKKTDRQADRESADEPKKSPAERRAANAKKAEQFKRRVAEWKLDWYRYLIAERLGKYEFSKPLDLAGQYVPTKLLLWLAYHREAMRDDPRRESIECAVQGHGGRPSGGRVFAALRSRPAVDIPRIATNFLIGLLFDAQDGPAKTFPQDVLEATIEDLEIDPAGEWLSDLAGPLTDEFFNLHTKDQLDELAVHWGLDTGADDWTKGKKTQRILLLKESSVIRAALPPSIAPAAKAKANKPTVKKGTKNQPRK